MTMTATPSSSEISASTSAAPADEERCDVCIIGAGWSGLLAARHMRENGLTVLLLERREGLGGVWRYTPDPEVVSVMRTTITSSSAAVTEASDFPMSPELGNFLHHADVLRYLERYAAHFDLTRLIRFGCSVEGAEKRDDRWIVRASGGRRVSARFLVVSTGTNQRRRESIPRLAGFVGETTHAGRIKEIKPEDFSAEDNVLVFGGGETASDIVEQLTKTEASITWSIPRGQHFFRKAAFPDRQAPGQYQRGDSPLDEASSRCIQLVSPFHREKPGMKWLCLIGSTGSVLGYEGHGIPQWRKDVPFMRAFVNKNGHVVEFVKTGRVSARGLVAKSSGQRVHFEDGHAEDFTRVILCTGYQTSFPYLPEQLSRRGVEERYKLIFDPDDPTVAFIGFARPNVGSIPMMTEPQCFYAARVFSGQVKLPARARMLAEIDEDRARRDAYFCGQRRSPGLVHCFHYGYEVARLAGVMPRFGSLLLRSPLVWFKTFFAPANCAQFRLFDPATRRAAANQMWRRQRVRYFVYPAIYVAARLLQVDRVVGAAQRVYMRLQRRAERAAPQRREPVAAAISSSRLQPVSATPRGARRAS